MKQIRSLIPVSIRLAGIAAVFVAGIAIAAQNLEEPKSTQPKPPAKAAPNANSDGAPREAAPADRAQPKSARADQPGRPDQPATEAQRAAALGVQFETQGDQGLIVKSIEPNGILAQGGLRQNDRIVSIEGYTFNSPRQIEAFLWSQPGRQIPVIIDRGGKQYTIQVNIPQRNANSGWLGVNLDEGDADVQGDANVKGARVTQVYPSGPASRAGLQPGDVITQINQQPVEGSADAVLLIRDLQPQAQAELVVIRDKEEVKIPVVVGTRGNFAYQSFYSPQQQQQYQPGQPGSDQRFAGNQQRGGNNQFGDVPPYAMQLEHDRRNAEQHERIEEEIRMLREEVRKLRELLEKK